MTLRNGCYETRTCKLRLWRCCSAVYTCIIVVRIGPEMGESEEAREAERKWEQRQGGTERGRTWLHFCSFSVPALSSFWFSLFLRFQWLSHIFSRHSFLCLNYVEVILLLLTKRVMNKTLGKIKYRTLVDILRAFLQVRGKWRDLVPWISGKPENQRRYFGSLIFFISWLIQASVTQILLVRSLS